MFDLSGRVAVVTGGSGSLGAAIARGLGHSGAHIALVARHRDTLEAVADRMRGDGVEVRALVADVLDAAGLRAAREELINEWGRIDVLVNAAGGNRPAATVPPEGTVFDLEPDALAEVVDLNLIGTFLPICEFGRTMAETGRGSIITISSMAATRPLSRVAGYGAAKAAVENLTRWLADHAARRFGAGLRVNAIAPGFFLGAQNRDLLVDRAGSLTDRGRRIVDATPMGRLGDPDDLVGPAMWLASDASRFVTGAVVPVDGGFSAAAGL